MTVDQTPGGPTGAPRERCSAAPPGPGQLSAYDRSVPHPAPDDRLAERFAALRDLRPAVSIDSVKDLVVVVSSSRSGSSMLAEILREDPGLLSIPEEINPHVVLAQLAGGDPAVVRAELARDVGRPARPTDEPDRDRLVADVRWRLAAQWPFVDIPAVRSHGASTPP